VGAEHDEVLDGELFGTDQPCFGCGPRHPIGFRLRFTRQEDGVLTRFTPGQDHQGPPGIMHGGLVATLADECAAWALIAELGRFGFTTTFEARYKRAIRTGVEVEAGARIVDRSRRLVVVEVELRQQGEVAFTGRFKFAVLDRKAAERLLGGPLPDGWTRFSRDAD
jgi:uncharacterized protein (TIGR00369 family)